MTVLNSSVFDLFRERPTFKRLPATVGCGRFAYSRSHSKKLRLSAVEVSNIRRETDARRIFLVIYSVIFLGLATKLN